jgi:hypothetical protein
MSTDQLMMPTALGLRSVGYKDAHDLPAIHSSVA